MTIRTKTLLSLAVKSTGMLLGLGIFIVAGAEAVNWYFCIRESGNA